MHKAEDDKPDTVGVCLLPPENMAMPTPKRVVNPQTMQMQELMVWQVQCHFRSSRNSTPACCEWEPLETIQ
jgi:hypothetical protein